MICPRGVRTNTHTRDGGLGVVLGREFLLDTQGVAGGTVLGLRLETRGPCRCIPTGSGRTGGLGVEGPHGSEFVSIGTNSGLNSGLGVSSISYSYRKRTSAPPLDLRGGRTVKKWGRSRTPELLYRFLRSRDTPLNFWLLDRSGEPSYSDSHLS